jgi:uncharacterized membrane protein YphA (DoxX/SURF4 family)
MVPATGLMIGLGAALVALGVWPDVGMLLIAGFVLPTAYFMHAYWQESDPQMRQQQQIHFMKNLSMGGAALALFAFYAQCGSDMGLQLVGPLL